jgi:hypothetical protein
LITHTITHIAHTLRLSAEWSHLTICKKLFDNVARSCFNCSIDNATGAHDMTRRRRKTSDVILNTLAAAFICCCVVVAGIGLAALKMHGL